MDDIAQTKLLRGLGLATTAITLVQLFVLTLPLLIANSSVYRPLVVEIVAFVLLTAVILSAGVFVWRERPFGWARWVLLGALAIAAAMALIGVPPAYLTEAAEWSFGVICWTGLLLLLDKGFLAVLAFLAGHLAMRVGLLAAVGGADRPSVVGASIFTSVFLVIQLAVAFAAVLLRRMATVATDAVRDEERVRLGEAVAEQLHRDRQERFAGLETVPLLTGLAAGVLDPADERVRVRCAVEASRMRRLFAENDEAADPLMHELRACLDIAERKGVVVHLATCGSWRQPPVRVRRALTEPVLASLAAATSEARVTVIGTPATVTVSVVTDGDPAQPAGESSGGITVSRLDHGGRHWVEATWRAVS